MAKRSTKKTGEGVLDTALDQFQEAQSATDLNRRDAAEDIRFGRLGDQWPKEIRKQRQLEGRPCLTVNRMNAFTRQVVNDARQNKPAISVVPVDSGADVDTAEVIGGLCRSIEQGSNAEIAYDTALENAVSGGFGFFRISLDYVHSDSFDMEARIERIANPLSVYWDASTRAFDASDWEYGFVAEWHTKSAFEQMYPGKDFVSFEGDYQDQTELDNFGQEQIRLAEYFLRTLHKRKIVQLSNGEVVREDALKKPMMLPDGQTMTLIDALNMSGITVQRERLADYYKVMRRILSGAEVLEEEEWPGQSIPICPVWGDEVIIDGRRHFRSLVRDARDPQMMFNFWRSASTELVALAPRAPFLIAEGQLPDGKEKQKWENANTRSWPYLMYKPVGGAMPQRQPFPSVAAGAIQEAANASDDMKATMGIYDAALGARGNETSGKAIVARQRESDTGTFHFIDNLSRAIRYAGRCLVEIIPSVYSQREAIRILGEDMAPKVVRLAKEGSPAPEQGQDSPNNDPKARLYDFNVGKYDVVVKTGPSFATRREESAVQMTELIRAYPPAAPIIGDLLVENLDWPGAAEVSKRLKKMLPPQLQDGQDGRPQGLLPEIQQQIAQGTELIQKLQQENAQMKGDMSKTMIEAQTKGKELEFKAREAELTNAIKARELSLKEIELQIKAAEMQATQMNAQAVAGADVDQKNAVTGLAQLVQQALGAATESNAATQQAFMAALGELKETMSRPKQIIRGPDGRAMGVQ
jgi:hypothetical protein